jgi:hypothetical protein
MSIYGTEIQLHIIYMLHTRDVVNVLIKELLTSLGQNCKYSNAERTSTA